MIFTIIGSAIAGAVVFGLVLRNNPKLAIKLLALADKLEDEIKDISKEKKVAPVKKETAKKKVTKKVTSTNKKK